MRTAGCFRPTLLHSSHVLFAMETFDSLPRRGDVSSDRGTAGGGGVRGAHTLLRFSDGVAGLINQSVNIHVVMK